MSFDPISVAMTKPKVINLDSYSGREISSGEDTTLSMCIWGSMVLNGKSYTVGSESISQFWRDVDSKENAVFKMTFDRYTLCFKETSRIHTSTDMGEYPSLVSVSLHCVFVQDGATIEMRIVIADGGTSATVIALPTNTPIA